MIQTLHKITVALVMFITVALPLSVSVVAPEPVDAATGIASCLISAAMGAIGVGIAGSAVSALFAVPTAEMNPSLTFTNPSTAGSSFMAIVKECILDPLAWMAKQLMISQMTDTILGWISIEGKNGISGPGFVNDPIAFLRDVTEESIMGTLVDAQIVEKNVCSDFAPIVKASVVEEFLTEDFSDTLTAGVSVSAASSGGVSSHVPKSACSLGVAGVDFNDFVENGNVDTKDGGIPALFSVINNANNPIGSFFNVAGKVQKEAQQSVAAMTKTVDWGDGFRAQFCEKGGVQKVCTPGKVIVDQLNAHLKSGLKQLEVADEFSEILDGVFSNVLNGILNQGIQKLSNTFDAANFDASRKTNTLSTGLSSASPTVPGGTTGGLTGSRGGAATCVNRTPSDSMCLGYIPVCAEPSPRTRWKTVLIAGDPPLSPNRWHYSPNVFSSSDCAFKCVAGRTWNGSACI